MFGGKPVKSTSFRNQYFQDHSRRIVMDERGKMRVEYVYEGVYHIAECTAKSWRLRKVLFLAALLTSGYLLLSAMLLDVACNYCRDVVFLQCGILFCLLGSAVGTVFRMLSGSKMTKWEYRIAVNTPKECAVLITAVALALVGDVLASMAAGRWTAAPAAWEVVLRIALLAAVQLFLALWVRRERYTEEISHDLPHGVDITNDFRNF